MSETPDRVIVFDLDDTLYLERDYVLSGIAAVGEHVAQRYEIAGFARAAVAAFEDGHRGTIFDVALAGLGLASSSDLIADLVQAYRRHRPRIEVAPDARCWLAARPVSTAVALITDGHADSQSNKVAALGLAEHGFAPIVITARLGEGFGKPHPRAFEMVADRFGLSPDRFTYVADNCLKDFVAPRRMGWNTIRIARPLGLHGALPPTPGHAPKMTIQSLLDLPAAGATQ